MSEQMPGESGESGESGDYFGRLLARYAPVAAGPVDPFGGPGGDGGAPGHTGGVRRVLVQPRLPGPFERVAALRGAGADEEDGTDPLYPRAAAGPTGPFAGEQPRYAREIRTTSERETVLRTEAARVADPAHAGQTVGPATGPLLRPAVAPDPGVRAATADGVRPRGRTGAAGAERAVPGRAAASSVSAAGAAGGPDGPVAALRPRADVLPPARTPAPRATPGGRRGQRGPAERVVHVQIGRLEVSAAGAERPAAGGRAARAERRAPSLTLADYLARGERAT
ncbi:hypothetical protein GCM10010211_56570 [Streptomyces albospinus]|uniref:Uncharacterized protein n=1 Tax=Streptomyces albospinus TaxID=285515 RepID=A0ABQ2VEQ0_9ACTN|nr:hypothetical protein [Streptomyces albospinus]GGU83274.1 hypothetical protein GCM10010211_56570 [Streptomyces albospinus]